MQGIARKLANKDTIELKMDVDANLIGGFVLHVGDRQIDASIRSKLRTLDLKFEENYFVKKSE